MRMFLPIKGPGGRALTPNEKLALLVLGVTLVICVLTLLAGERAFLPGTSQNPVLAMVSVPSRVLGGGVVALYALILTWSGLVYFRGERIARVTPLAGRLIAALGVTVGISGVLGVAQAGTAGSMGVLVGGAIDHTLGGVLGIALLLVLVLLGFSLAAQGTWAALVLPTPAAAGGIRAPLGTASAFYTPVSSRRHTAQESAIPDDGDPSAEARTLAVTNAMEEIERNKGVTIVSVENTEAKEAAVARPSIGEEVADAPPPAPETEEATVQRGLLDVVQALETRSAGVEGERFEPPYRAEIVPAAPPADAAPAPVESAPMAEACSEPLESQSADGYAEPAAPPPEPPVSEVLPPPQPPPESPQACAQLLFVPEEGGDPYATPGLLRRANPEVRRPPEGEAEKTPRNYASFDWRGRPLDG